MPYIKQNFQSGDVLFASQLNAMDEQIAANLEAIENMNLAGGGTGDGTGSGDGAGAGAGTSISDIEKIEYVGKDGTADLYVVVLTDGSEHFLTVNNSPATGGSGEGGSGESGAAGVGIVKIERTSGNGAAGGTDVYTITLSNGSTYNFTVYNGKDGANAIQGATINSTGNLIITLDNGETLDAGSARGPAGTRGNKWYTGTAMTGTDREGVVFSGSGISAAYQGDMYLAKNTGYVYECVTGGSVSGAKWAYVASIKGASGSNGSFTSDATINADGHLWILLSDGTELDAGLAKGEKGDPGTKWHLGTAISGLIDEGTVYSYSDVTQAEVNDLYLNTSNGRLYECTQGGAPESAKWAYLGSLRGATGSSGKDGANAIQDATINSAGNLIITLDNGDTLNAGKAKGAEGYSPSITISNVTGGKYIEIKSMDEGLVTTQGFYLYNGADGTTPVRGTDYWTASDIATIKSYVDDAILGGSW